MEQILTVEDTQIKDKKCILLRIKGGKQFVLQCEVGPAHNASLFCVCSQWGEKKADAVIFFSLSLSPCVSAERPGVRAVEERAD